MIDSVNSAVTKSDFSGILQALQEGGNRLRETLPKISSDKIREFISKIMADIGELMKKISSNQGRLDDVRKFIDDAKDGLKQRLADKIN